MGTKDADANSHRRFSIKCDYLLISRVLSRIKFEKIDYHFTTLYIQYKRRQETEAKRIK